MARLLAIAFEQSTLLWESSSITSTSRTTREAVHIKHSDRCKSVAWTTNGKAVASAGGSDSITLHSRSGKLTGSLANPGDKAQLMGSVQCLSFSRGSKFLAAGRADGVVHVWGVKQQVKTISMKHP